MSVRDLPDRLVIEQGTAASTQARLMTWSTLATVWGAVTPAGGGAETPAGAAMHASTRYEVEIPYRTDVTASMRVQWTPYRGTAKTLQIEGVDRAWLPSIRGRAMRTLLRCVETR
jgi:head-tail adaptor